MSSINHYFVVIRYWTNVKERKLAGVIRHRDYDGQTNTRNARRGRAGEELAARDGIKSWWFPAGEKQMVMRWRETGPKPSQITWRTRWLYLSDRKLLHFKNSLKKCSELLRSTIVLVKKLNSQICPTVTMWPNLNNKQNK